MRQIKIFIILVALLAFPIIGQTDNASKSPIGIKREVMPPSGELKYTSGELINDIGLIRPDLIIQPRSMTEIYLCLGVLAFGLILVISTIYIAHRKKTGWDYEATRIFAFSVVITAGLFLMTAGYGSEQVAPMFGLLGTIVGYLLGKPPGNQNPDT